MLILSGISAKTMDVNSIVLEWSFEDSQEDLGLYSIQVWKSESPGVSGLTGYEIVASGLSPSLPLYQDFSVSGLFSHNRMWYYKLLVVGPSSQTVVPLKPAYVLYQSPNSSYRYVYNNKKKALSKAVGRPFHLLKKKTWGQTCPIGWDPILGGPSAAECDACTCFGTGRYNAYFQPIPLLAMINTNPKITQIALFGEFMPSDTLMHSLEFPPIAPRDIIVDDRNRRWYVQQVRTVELLGAVLEQICQLSLIHPDDRLYSIEVP
jgi:hypothetical protein